MPVPPLKTMKLRTRLLVVNIIVCAAFATAMLLVLSGYTTTRNKLDTIVEHGVESVSANAEIGRDFALLFSDTAVLAETGIGREDLLQSRGAHLEKRSRELGRRHLDPELKTALDEYVIVLNDVLSLCSRINEVTHTLNTLDNSVLERIDSLRHSLPDDAVEDMLRRAVLESRHVRATLDDRDFTGNIDVHPLFAGLSGIQSAVREISPSSPDSAAALRRFSEQLDAEQEALEEYFLLRKRLIPIKNDLHFAMDRTMALLGTMDSNSRTAAVDVRDELGAALAEGRNLILLLFAGVMIVSGVLTALFFRHGISRPMAALCDAAQQIGKEPTARVQLGRTDEWNEVEAAMNTMADNLAGIAVELRSKNAALRSAQAALESKVAELHEQIEARAVAELKARTLNTELERRVDNRTAELETAFKELESLSYSIAHDLRRPLRSIDGFSHALLDDYGDKLDDEGRDHLQRVRAAVQQLGRLFDDFQHLTSVTRAKMRRSRFELSALAREIGRELRKKYPDREVEFIVQDGLNVLGDRHLLRLALTHLLDNAWKFTKRREQAVIEVGSALEEDEEVFFVSDNGEGFDMRYAHKLFGPMNQLHAPDEFGGGGLGLAVIQRVIHRHSGRIWAVGEKGDGATFHFTLQDGSERT